MHFPRRFGDIVRKTEGLRRSKRFAREEETMIMEEEATLREEEAMIMEEQAMTMEEGATIRNEGMVLRGGRRLVAHDTLTHRAGGRVAKGLRVIVNNNNKQRWRRSKLKKSGNLGGLVEKVGGDLITRITALGLRRSRRIAGIEKKIEYVEEKKRRACRERTIEAAFGREEKIEAVEEKKIDSGRERTKRAACGKEKKRRAFRKGGEGEDVLRRGPGKRLVWKNQFDKGDIKRKRKEVLIQNYKKLKWCAAKEGNIWDQHCKDNVENLKVWNLPVLVMEKVFSFLDWKSMGKAMLVCRLWNEMAGHPSLWSSFPLHLTCLRRLGQVAKIGRLAWVKSVTISLPLRWLRVSEDFIGPVSVAFPRVEELFVNCGKLTHGELNKVIWALPSHRSLQCKENRIARIGVRNTSTLRYLVSSCDYQTETFIKRTFEPNGLKNITIASPFQDVELSNETLKTVLVAPTVCKTCDIRQPISFTTNLNIRSDVDLTSLANSLKRNVWCMNWLVNNGENQQLAPLEAILKLLREPGVFRKLTIQKELLLKSSWASQLPDRDRFEGKIGTAGRVTLVKMIPNLYAQ